MKKSIDLQIGDLVLYKNNQLIAFNKPAGLAVQNDPTGEKCLLELAENYVQHPLNLIHRLDRPAGGVVLLAQNKKALANLNEQFRQRQVEKVYLAIVSERPPADEGQLRHFLKKDAKTNKALVSDTEAPGSQEAILNYRYRGSIEHYHLLEINLVTGRHHQIRAQLAAIGCPIKDDVKYGARRGNPQRSICLHAWKLSFNHPVSNERQTILAPPPDEPVWRAFEFLES